MAKDNVWIFKCPKCKTKVNTNASKHTLVECPGCLNIFEIQEDLSAKDFRDVLYENSKKRKTKSNMNEKEKIEVIRLI